jgi:hypothetical protein
MPPPTCIDGRRGSLVGNVPGDPGIGGVDVEGCPLGAVAGRRGSVAGDGDSVALGALVAAAADGCTGAGAVLTGGVGLVAAAFLRAADTGAPATGDGATVTTPDASDSSMALGICAVTSSAAM